MAESCPHGNYVCVGWMGVGEATKKITRKILYMSDGSKYYGEKSEVHHEWRLLSELGYSGKV